MEIENISIHFNEDCREWQADITKRGGQLVGYRNSALIRLLATLIVELW